MENRVYKKKNWLGMLIVIMLAALPATTVKAVKKYGIRIAGVEVTDKNDYNLSVIPGVEGAYYDDRTNTLGLINATIQVDEGNAIHNYGCNDLTIKVEGNCYIYAKENAIGILLDKQTKISGLGTLTCNADLACVYLNKTTLTIDHTHFNAMGGMFGIIGKDDGKDSKLLIYGSYVKAKGSYASISEVGIMNLMACLIRQPSGAIFNGNTHSVTLDGNTVTDEVYIYPQSFGFKVAGIEVDEGNYENISSFPGVEKGKIYYNREDNRLELENVYINKKGECCIHNWNADKLYIGLTGNNSLSISGNVPAIRLDKETIFEGRNERLSIYSDYCGIYMNEAPLTISYVNVNISKVDDPKWGITGTNGKPSEKLTLIHSSVKAGSTEGAICNIGALEFDFSEINSPYGAAYDESLKGIAENGKIALETRIKPQNLYIVGTQLSTPIINSISTLYGVSGDVRYYRNEKRLYLKDAYLSFNDEFGVPLISDINGLTIELHGKNEIFADLSAAVVLHGETIFTGDGELTIWSNDDTALYIDKTGVTIENCTMDITGMNGIAGPLNSCTNESVTIKRANVKVNGYDGTVKDIKMFTLDDCRFVSPEGVMFDKQRHCLTKDGEEVKETVVIERTTTGINNIQTDATLHRQGIYNIQGMKLEQPWKALPAGMYIVDGVKKVKK